MRAVITCVIGHANDGSASYQADELWSIPKTTRPPWPACIYALHAMMEESNGWTGITHGVRHILAVHVVLGRGRVPSIMYGVWLPISYGPHRLPGATL